MQHIGFNEETEGTICRPLTRGSYSGISSHYYRLQIPSVQNALLQRAPNSMTPTSQEEFGINLHMCTAQTPDTSNLHT